MTSNLCRPSAAAQSDMSKSGTRGTRPPIVDNNHRDTNARWYVQVYPLKETGTRQVYSQYSTSVWTAAQLRLPVSSIRFPSRPHVTPLHHDNPLPVRVTCRVWRHAQLEPRNNSIRSWYNYLRRPAVDVSPEGGFFGDIILDRLELFGYNANESDTPWSIVCFSFCSSCSPSYI